MKSWLYAGTSEYLQIEYRPGDGAATSENFGVRKISREDYFSLYNIVE